MLVDLNHITIAVSDIEKSFDFYVNILGFKPQVKWDKGVYLTLGVWICLSLDEEVDPSKDYTHIAFTISEENFEKMKNILKRNNVKEWKKNTSEGPSIYFLDPDNRKFEIHLGTLESRLAYTKKNKPYNNLVWYDYE